MPDYIKLLEVARSAVGEACLVARDVQRGLEQVREITKDDRSPVTVADFACQAVIGKRLRDELGRDVILVGEEDSGYLRDDDHELVARATLAAVQDVWPDATHDQMLDAIDVGAGDTHHGSFWTLDPIDGTKGFLRGRQYAISLAYVERGDPVIGVLGCPNLPTDFSRPFDEPDNRGAMYFCIRGSGVWEIDPADPLGDATEIKRFDHEAGQAITVCASVEKAHSSVSDMDRILEHIGEPSEPVRLDSQAKYAVVARGQADAYLRLPTRKDYVERIWDHAAGALIAGEAGAYVTDIHGRDLEFSHGRGLEKNKGVVCAPPRVHGLLLGAIEALEIGAG